MKVYESHPYTVHKMQDLIFPIHGEAHALPYANDFFDAIICINSFQFYGTADNFLIRLYGTSAQTGGAVRPCGMGAG